MHERITFDGVTKEEMDKHEAEWGKYNEPPPNLTEITEEEFVTGGFFTWCHEKMESRQIDLSSVPKKNFLSPKSKYGLYKITLFFMNHGDHYAMGISDDDKKVRYFKFARCFHKWEEISAKEAGKQAFSCYHYCKCFKCGAQWEYDSSG